MSELFGKSVSLTRGSTLSDQVTEALRQNVTSGAWPVGSMLPSEAMLCQELNVSRTVIREAVARLKAEGLLSSQQGRGAFVASNRSRLGFSIDAGDVDNRRTLGQILELRMGIEIEAAAIAARRRTEADLDTIREAVEAFAAQQRHSPENARAGVEADLRFHRAICEATRNSYYLAFYDYLSASLRETIEAGRERALQRGGDSREAAEEHRSIVEAIAEQDMFAARKRMRKHLELSRDRLLGQLWDHQGEQSDLHRNDRPEAAE
ncbi:FadR/GntR family transcriptional regulator [Pseudooceanicola nanhaiensis]|uniref:FadR/GntR family transcriptional regulator n=1 Tax=Pseudooceanicola nanhaiensis TaxID=375761 RepID=UPI001CD38384|nr:FadR/GntR family transcriptional regulator [Pseudooceanicola nanhaiensis]MCA0920845.1 FadR family transcriptional regulator [Pseudooceanicola nanhaiensis]